MRINSPPFYHTNSRAIKKVSAFCRLFAESGSECERHGILNSLCVWRIPLNLNLPSEIGILFFPHKIRRLSAYTGISRNDWEELDSDQRKA